MAAGLEETSTILSHWGTGQLGLTAARHFAHGPQHTGEILHQKFLSLELPAKAFDGIFANASLFHVPRQHLPRVLDDLRSAIRPGGVLFLSNPRGDDEGWSGQRYGHYMQFESSKLFLEQAGFQVIDHYYRPSGKPRHEQPWLAIVAQIGLFKDT